MRTKETANRNHKPRRKRQHPSKQHSKIQTKKGIVISCGVCGIDRNGGKYKCPKCRLFYCSVKCCKDHKLKCPSLQHYDASESNANVITDVTTNSNASSNGKSPDSTPIRTTRMTNTKSNYLPSDALTADPLANARQRRDRLNDDDDSDNNDDSDEEDREGWRITREMMDRLDESSWLRTELADGGLRQMIYEIDAAVSADGETRTRRFPKKRKRGTLLVENLVQLSERELALEKAKLTNPKFATFLDKLLLEAGVLNEHRAHDQDEADQVLASLLKHDDDNLGHLSLVPIKIRTNTNRTLLESTATTSNEESDETSSDSSTSVGNSSSSEDED